jgi:hypothetical protein
VFALGMAKLELCFRDASLDSDSLRRRALIYADELGDEMTDEQWAVAVKRAVRECRFFPRISELFAFALDPVGSALARAAEVFEAILEEYESGRALDHRTIAERWGLAARDAFMAAGGAAAFTWCGDAENRRWRLKAFQDGWKEHEESRGSLSPGRAVAQLGSGE